jgi:dihydroorotate dehydrogenase
MYKYLIRPILFLLPPEKVHSLIVILIKTFFRVPGFFKVAKTLFSYKKARELALLGLRFPSRVGLAAGFDKIALFYKEFSAFGFGFIEIGTVTPKAKPGNPKPRRFRLTAD